MNYIQLIPTRSCPVTVSGDLANAESCLKMEIYDDYEETCVFVRDDANTLQMWLEAWFSSAFDTADSLLRSCMLNKLDVCVHDEIIPHATVLKHYNKWKKLK